MKIAMPGLPAGSVSWLPGPAGWKAAAAGMRRTIRWLAGGACIVLPALAIPILPLSLALALVVSVAGAAILLVVARLPPIDRLHGRVLLAAFALIYALYFAWPRSVFLPLLYLPIKHPQKLLYYAFVLAWMIMLIRSREMRQRLVRGYAANRLLVGVLLWMLAWRTASVAAASIPLFSSIRLVDEIVTSYLLFPIVLSLVAGLDDARRVMTALVSVAVLNVALAVPEVLLRRNVFEPFVSVQILDPAMAQLLLSEKLREGGVRAQAAFDHPLLLAEYLALLLPFPLAQTFLAARRRWAHAAVCLLLGLGILLARTRTGMLVALLSAVLMAMLTLLLRRRLSAGVLALGLPVALIGAAVFGVLAVQLTLGRNLDEMSSSFARIRMLHASLPMIWNAPWLGYGLGLGGRELDFTVGGIRTLDSHLLMAALDSGLPYLLGLLLFIAAIAGASLRALTGELPPARRWFHRAAICAICGFLAFKLILGTDLNNSLLFVFAALVAALRREDGGWLPRSGARPASGATGG
ncbi:MAG TPA: O-antigen ligase family protein [Burkholderiaceae bacterium]|nr:O-antigen ligase family protein [Burkholderiaceae bacterium]